MWLSLIFVLVVIAIAIRQATFGMFSAMIMAVLTVCCATLAIGMHEWVAATLVAPYWKPEYAYAIAIGAGFGVPMIILRIVLDKVIRRSCLLPAIVDRIGAGVFALVTSMTMAGVGALCFLTIPFGPSILGFSRVPVLTDDAGAPAATVPGESATGDSLWLGPDRFAVGLASFLSSGVFHGERAFGQDNPDFVEATGWVGAASPEVSRFTAPKSIAIARTTRPLFIYERTPGNRRDATPDTFKPIEPAAGEEFHMIGVQLHDAARDSHQSHMFTLHQFRLVGNLSASGLIEQYHPIALQQEDAEQVENRHIKCVTIGGQCRPILDDLFNPRDSGSLIEIVFSLPKGFEPSFLEYKHGARASVKFDSAASQQPSPPAGPAPESTTTGATGATPVPETPSGTAAAPTQAVDPVVDNRSADATATPADTPAAAPQSGEGESARPTRGSRRRGGARRAAAQAEQSFFGDQMPMELRSYRRLRNVELVRDALRDGHLVGEVAVQASGADPPVTRFEVPEDKRLLQLDTSFMRARSRLARAMSSAIETVNSYTVMDQRGRRYSIAGKYAIADVNGKRIVEVQYFSSPTGAIGGLGKFDRIGDDHLKGDYQLVMLFLVEPGARITSFSTGSDASRGDDLTTQNLTAPQ